MTTAAFWTTNHQFEILWSVVVSETILVMDSFARKQISTEDISHNEAVVVPENTIANIPNQISSRAGTRRSFRDA